MYKFACLVKDRDKGPKDKDEWGRALTSQLALVEDNPAAEAELMRRSQAFVKQLGAGMTEVINRHSTQVPQLAFDLILPRLLTKSHSFANKKVGKTKVFMKATYAYTLHRIAELTEHHWVRKLQRQV